MPWQVSRLTIAELDELARMERLRWNRTARLAAWLVVQVPSLIAMGVGHAIVGAFGKNKGPMAPIPFKRVLRSLPDHWDPDEE